MTYRKANVDRLAFLIEHGLSPSELRRFLTGKRTSLLLANVKPRKVPPDHQSAARWVAHLPDAAHTILGAWIEENLSVNRDEGIDDVAGRFHAIEDEPLSPVEPETMRRLCRSGLRAFYGASPPSGWLTFMASSLKGELDEERESQEIPHATAAVLEAFVRCVHGEKDPSDVPDGDLRLAATLLAASRNRNAAIVSELPGDPNQYENLRRLLEQGPHLEAGPRGLLAAPPVLEEFDPDVDYSTYEVIATRLRTGSPSALFLDVEAYIAQDDAHTQSPIDLRKAFPDRGEIILFPDRGLDPPIGRPIAYRVQRTDTPGNAKLRVQAVGRPLLPVIYVPVASADPDGVREWLVSRSAAPSLDTNALLVLSDGLCIKVRSGAAGRIGSVEFDWSFDAWESVSAVEFRKGAYVVCALPHPARRFECAPLSVSARRLLKRLAERKSLSISKQQIANLAEQIGQDEEEADASLKQRVIGKLTTLSRAESEYQELVNDLMRTDTVRADIAARKQEELALIDGEARAERAALEQLRRERQMLQDSISSLKEQHSQRVKELRAAMRRAFDNARDKEADTLANAGLLQILRGDESPGKERRRERQSSGPGAAPLAVQTLEADSSPVSDVFRSVGCDDELSTLLGEAVHCCITAGAPLIIGGPGAAVVGVAIGQRIARGSAIVVNIPVALASPEPFNQALSGRTEGALILRNANLSDLVVYAPLLIDQIVLSILGTRTIGHIKAVILTEASGPAALPWPAELEHCAMRIDLARDLTVKERVSTEIAVQHDSPLQGRVWRRLAGLIEESTKAAKLERLCAELLLGRTGGKVESG